MYTSQKRLYWPWEVYICVLEVFINKSKRLVNYGQKDSLWSLLESGLGPRSSMAANFRASAMIFVFALHAYYLTSRDGKLPVQDLFPLRGYRISASLIQISLSHATYHHGTNRGRSAVVHSQTRLRSSWITHSFWWHLLKSNTTMSASLWNWLKNR